MKKHLLSALVCTAFLSITSLGFANAVPITSPNHIWINTVNDALYGTTGNQWGTPTNPDAYYVKFDGGGLNQLRFTTDNSKAGEYGQVTSLTTNSSTGTGSFFISTTGGRGYNDDIILLASVQASNLSKISDSFSLNISASGYTWTPQSTQTVGADKHFVSNAINVTAGKSDLQYGPNNYKIGTSIFALPFYSGQNVSDPSTAAYMMFIDLHLGNFTNNNTDLSNTYGGEIKVDYSFSGLFDSVLAFNAYAYTLTSNTGADSINWTNNVLTDLATANQTGYSITSTATPTPVPAAIWLFGSGLMGLAGLKRRSKA